MKITIDWQKPVQLTEHKKILFEADDMPDRIESSPGVYMFTRKHGKVLFPFYIGETDNVRRRLKEHLDSAKIYKVLIGATGDQEIKAGPRFFNFGYLRGDFQKAGVKKRLDIVQRYIIQKAIELDIPILNSSLTKRPTHQLTFTGAPQDRVYLDPKVAVPAK